MQLTINDQWKDKVTQLCHLANQSVGPKPTASLMPYRYSCTNYFALDIHGKDGDFNITMIESDKTKIEFAEEDIIFGGHQQLTDDIYVVDMIDAFYLAKKILDSFS